MDRHSAQRRARRSFWACLILAIALSGALSAQLRADPGPGTAIAAAGIGVLLAAVLALATRLLLALTGRLPAAGRGRQAGRSRRT
jgi:hypothetical protein